ncbi:conserved hypothetical protein [Ketogulonicigenium vulgare Y25]|uniref:DUF2793 domain-containing protein n=1 Tax=Ketogulonicigenium vulgare TaxID=92945 RepID=UPI0001E66B79|nr:DUF2793 domain-containing protein [Ketogulonicigenium vulgare]ADO43586.1 conserved hypothetical protein [Ketogulonicigenium vulgare Y25]
MSQTTTRLALPLVQPAQAQKHVTVNESLQRLDTALQACVESTVLNVPPLSPADGQCWLVGSGGSGAWTGLDNVLVGALDGGWHPITPADGWRIWDKATQNLLVRTDGAWQVIGSAGMNNLPRLGINAAADSVNVLAAHGPATLLYNSAGGHQLKVNKAAPADTASLLFQSGWSGRAEMGLAGEDHFSVKVSADGGTFHTALHANGATGAVELPQGGTAQGHALVHLGMLLGTVAQTAGVPTGAVIESGTNTNGSYLRLANGTQICWRSSGTLTANTAQGSNFISGASSLTYPVAFISAPSVSATPVAANIAWAYATAGGGWAYATAVGASNVTLRFAAPVTATQGTISILAIGRWF